jgi:hypothetical protein
MLWSSQSACSGQVGFNHRRHHLAGSDPQSTQQSASTAAQPCQYTREGVSAWPANCVHAAVVEVTGHGTSTCMPTGIWVLSCGWHWLVATAQLRVLATLVECAILLAAGRCLVWLSSKPLLHGAWHCNVANTTYSISCQEAGATNKQDGAYCQPPLVGNLHQAQHTGCSTMSDSSA